MMMQIPGQLIVLLLAFVLLSCNSTRKATDYTISMIATGFEDSTKFRLLHLDRQEFIDSAYLVNGKLQFKGRTSEPFPARIHAIDNKYVILWIEDEQITIEGDYKDLFYSKIKGSPLNDVMTKYRDKQAQFQIERDSLTQRMINLMSSREDNAREEFDMLNKQVRHLDKEIFAIRLDGIVSEKPSYFTIQELYFLRNDFTKDSLQLLFRNSPESLQKTKYGDVIQTYIDRKTLAVGDHFVDVEGLNEEGEMIKLSQFSGKYILLDFWASWCGPCRQENPNLLKAYKEYSSKGFQVLSFSIDNNEDMWRKAVKKDSLIWPNVIDSNGSYSKMSALYGVRAIPASFLINPEGIIIAKDLRGDSLEKRLQEVFHNSGLGTSHKTDAVNRFFIF
jgi:peroxiredoxin